MPSLRAGLLATALACSTCAGLPACAPDAPSKPNLLLISVDTLRADHLACYGGEADVGTALCSIGDRGVRYTWAFSTAPSTAPSVASLLTSTYPQEHGVRQVARTALSEGAVTLAEPLVQVGYATAAFVANPVIKRFRNLHQGFQIYDDKMVKSERNRPEYREREARELTGAALRWAQVASEPWFLWIHYQDPHGPYDAPDAGSAWDPAGAEALPVLENESGYRGIPRYQLIPGIWSQPGYERRYHEEIRYLDRQVARLLAALEGDRPLGVLFTADHGEAFGEDDYYFAHGHSLGLDQIRVPMIWRPPGGVGPRRETTPVSNLDVAPTLLSAAGLAPPESFRGRPLPTGAATKAPARTIFAEHPSRIAAMAGPTYYARDLEDLSEVPADRISGGALQPLPPRVAALEADGRVPDYRPAGSEEARALEQSVRTHLRERRDGSAAVEAEVDAETRDALRALGYLE